MIVDVRFFAMLLLFLFGAVVMTMGERTVVVLVRMPVTSMFPLAQRVIAVVVRDVVVVVRVCLSGMRVLWLASLPLSHLTSRASTLRLHIRFLLNATSIVLGAP